MVTWAHGNRQRRTIHILIGMCDLTQFVVSSITHDINAMALAQSFMSDIVMTFGTCLVVAIDDGSTFKGFLF